MYMKEFAWTYLLSEKNFDESKLETRSPPYMFAPYG